MEEKSEIDEENQKSEREAKRIYREELYEDINSVSSVGRTFILLVILSSFVAAIGLLRANVAIIIGVMVAVALLPPLMVFGLLVGDGQFQTSLNALLLLMTNVVCVNISGVAMFLFQGVRPNSWWEAKKG